MHWQDYEHVRRKVAEEKGRLSLSSQSLKVDPYVGDETFLPFVMRTIFECPNKHMATMVARIATNELLEYGEQDCVDYLTAEGVGYFINKNLSFFATAMRIRLRPKGENSDKLSVLIHDTSICYTQSLESIQGRLASLKSRAVCWAACTPSLA